MDSAVQLSPNKARKSMSSAVQPSPNKARKSMRSQNNISATPNINQSASSETFTSVSNSARKNARKSTGTCSSATISNQTTQLLANRTRNSTGISQNSTISLSQPNCSRDDDSSDSDIQPQKVRRSARNTQNSTVSFSQPGCSKVLDSSDSEEDVSTTLTQKLPSRNTSAPATRTSKKAPPAHVSSSSPPSTSEESEVEEMLKKKAAKKNKTETEVGKSSAQKSRKSVGNSLVSASDLANQCVFYILVANQSKKAIRKRDIIQHVFEGQNNHMFPEVIQKAASALLRTFGLELMELKSNKSEYLLVNSVCHKYEVREFAEYSREERQKQGFIFYVLTLIFMNENSISEDKLWKALDPLGIEINSRKPHAIFGDVQKFVTNTLVKQMYLERRQISKDPVQFELSWGERAHKEVLKEDLLDFVCMIMPDTKPKEWILQYKDAKGRSPEGDADVEME